MYVLYDKNVKFFNILLAVAVLVMDHHAEPVFVICLPTAIIRIGRKIRYEIAYIKGISCVETMWNVLQIGALMESVTTAEMTSTRYEQEINGRSPQLWTRDHMRSMGHQWRR